MTFKKLIVSLIASIALTTSAGSLVVPMSNVEAATVVSDTTINLGIGQKKKIKIKGVSGAITWVSSNPSVATVNKKGKVKGISEGNVTITAKAGDAQYQYNINVYEEEQNNASIKSSKVYKKIMSMQKKYPEGMPWTNNNSYDWHAIPEYSVVNAHGCVAFAAILSDAAFGTRPAKTITKPSASKVRVGDMLRINNDTHTVIVLEISDESFVIVEGNYNQSVHWGRTIPKDTKIDYMYTRY